MNNGTVFAIEEFSTQNGPGIRQTVFLKGCPLRCTWCHNPEGQTAEPQILRSRGGCLRCGACEAHAATVNGKRVYTEESVRRCPRRLLRVSGESYTPQALCEKLSRNFSLTGDEGGVTFSGGEPLLQAELLLSCLMLLRGQTHRAVQTCGYAAPEVFSSILQETDLVLYDIKLIDDAAHRRYTGVSNKRILQNFDTLCRSGVPFTVRTPLIPTVTDTVENLTAIARLLAERRVERIELLPYNTLAGSKYPLAERDYAPGFDETVPPEPREAIFAAHGVTATVL